MPSRPREFLALLRKDVLRCCRFSLATRWALRPQSHASLLHSSEPPFLIRVKPAWKQETARALISLSLAEGSWGGNSSLQKKTLLTRGANETGTTLSGRSSGMMSTGPSKYLDSRRDCAVTFDIMMDGDQGLANANWQLSTDSCR